MCNNVHVRVYINLMLGTLFSMVVPVYGDLYGYLSIPPHVHVHVDIQFQFQHLMSE